MELTRFEKARIIGARALQLAYGAPPLIKEIILREIRRGGQVFYIYNNHRVVNLTCS
ncbi:MAG TPA: hypothetical protein EYP80_00340 [Candidatus Aenigmarchaeota archaeon]|nr:hypothetical protein [Candidatus Aenigmarchaeota archaeon]